MVLSSVNESTKTHEYTSNKCSHMQNTFFSNTWNTEMRRVIEKNNKKQQKQKTTVAGYFVT